MTEYTAQDRERMAVAQEKVTQAWATYKTAITIARKAYNASFDAATKPIECADAIAAQDAANAHAETIREAAIAEALIDTPNI